MPEDPEKSQSHYVALAPVQLALASGQPPGAKLWIDDYFAGKYPE